MLVEYAVPSIKKPNCPTDEYAIKAFKSDATNNPKELKIIEPTELIRRSSLQ